MDRFWHTRTPRELFLSRYTDGHLMSRRTGGPSGMQYASSRALVGSDSLTNRIVLKQPTDSDGSLSSGYGSYYCDNGISLAILALTLAALAGMFYILYTKITMLVGRRKRHAGQYNTPVQQPPNSSIHNIEGIISFVYWGRIYNSHINTNLGISTN